MIGLGLYSLKDDTKIQDINYHNLEELLGITQYNKDLYQSGLKDVEFILPCDVQNPMLGNKGAVYVFGP